MNTELNNESWKHLPETKDFALQLVELLEEFENELMNKEFSDLSEVTKLQGMHHAVCAVLDYLNGSTT